jgi:hypothetical protein
MVMGIGIITGKSLNIGARHAVRLLLFWACISPAHADALVPATLAVTIQDEDGALIHDAHVYIFSRNQKEFLGMCDADGNADVDLPAGGYRLYAAMTRNTNGWIDHYASPEAAITLTSGETTSVILSIRKAETAPVTLNETALQRLGIAEELAKYLN